LKDTSNSLRQALAGQGQDGPHPDIDLLNGFVEGSLTPRERATLLAHLATCARCREVVNVSAAATPDEAAERVVVTVPARKALGVRFAWLASAAAIAVVATVAVIHESGKKPAPDFARDAAPTQQTAQINKEQVPVQSANESVQPALPKTAAPAQSPVAAEKRQLRAKLATNAPQAVRDSGRTTESSQLQSSRAVVAAEAQPRQEVAVNSSNQVVVARKESDSSDQLTGVVAGASGSGSGVAAAPASNDVYMARVVPSQNGAQQAMAPRATIEGTTTSLKKAAVLGSATQQHWRIDNNGHLQRSNLQGGWETLLDGERVRFRVVSILGNDVWAGGDKLRLYHSSDSGASWTSANLPPKATEEQSITHIHFANPQTGRVESDTGTVWTTNDGGLTWK